MPGKDDVPTLRDVTIGVVTALPIESTAVVTVLGCDIREAAPGHGDGRTYKLGVIESKYGGHHVIAVATLDQIGNESAAVRATNMAIHCPNLKHIVMCGIAGAIPNPSDPEKHVRLGDIVVSNQDGVIKYDFVKKEPDKETSRSLRQAPSSLLLDAVTDVRTEEELGAPPWLPNIEYGVEKLGDRWARPDASEDILQDNMDIGPIPHPDDPDRTESQPRVFHGIIAAADTLLKDPAKRDELRDKLNARAVEMEGGGVVQACWHLGRGYLVVRGACDYCNELKNDTWQRYAALIAASYTKSVLEHTPPVGSSEVKLNKGFKQRGTIARMAAVGAIAYKFGSDLIASIAQGLAGEKPRPSVPEQTAEVPPQVASNESVRIASESIDDTVREMLEDLQSRLDVFDHDRATVISEELTQILETRGAEIDSDLRMIVCETIANYEVYKARDRHSRGEELDFSRAKYFIGLANDAQ